MERSLHRKLTCAAALLAAAMAFAQAPLSLDPTFATQIIEPIGVGGTNVSSVLPLEDGSLFIAGQFRFPGDPPQNRWGARLLPNGSKDPMFPYSTATSAKLTRWQDKIYAQFGQEVSRSLLNGSADPTFTPLYENPYFLSGVGGDFHVFDDGSFVFGGSHLLSDTDHGFEGMHNFIWFTNTGALDTTKIHRQGNGGITLIKQLSNGQFLCGGNVITEQDGHPVGRVFRLNEDGSVDPSFSCPLDWGRPWSASELTDGRVVVSGIFKASSLATDTLHMVRLMPDGSIDPTFNNELDVWWPFASQLLPIVHTTLTNGQFILHGSFHTIDGQERFGIALVNEDGTLSDDAFTDEGCGTFVFNGFPYGATNGIVEGYDGMWYIYGSYIGYDGNSQQRFVSRLYPPDLTTGVSSAPPQQEILLAPNPASGVVRITLDHVGTGAQMILRDLTGRAVLRYPLRSGQQEHVLDLSSCTAGIYLVEIVQDGRQILPAEKLVIQ